MRVIRFILETSKPYRLYFFGMFFAIFLVSLDNAVKPFLVKRLIDTVSRNSYDGVEVICVYYGLLQFMLIVAWGLLDYCMVRSSSPFRCDIVRHFMGRLYVYPHTFFQNNLTGNISSKLGDAFHLTIGLVFTAISQFGYFFFLLLFALGLLFQVHPFFTVIMLVWVLLFSGRIFFSMRKAIKLTNQYAEEKSKILGLAVDYLGNMFSVKTFTNKDFELELLHNREDTFIKAGYRQGFYFMRFYIIQGLLTFFYALGFIVSLIYGNRLGLVSPGDFALVVMLNFNIISNLYQLSHTLRDFVNNYGTVDQALGLLENVPEIADKKGALPLHVPQGRIVFETVRFQYKGADPLFENKSIVIEAGQKVGLVGYSGGGKSTFVNLILRLYDVTQGRILIDGQDIRDITQDSLRTSIGMIPQDPSLFHRSLMENIRYGRIDAMDDEVIEASKRAHAHEFISKIPEGYHALVGERGIKLSGGQRQRIAIARAFLKNAPILILDEATSQLDSITEKLIQESLWHLMKNKTTIVIAHRLSTLLHMDRILVFEQGKIVEDGSHQDLLKKGGLYKTLWDSQVGGFLPDKKRGEEDL